MNNTDKLKELFNSIGVLAEMWIITFNQFKSMGLDAGDALNHTRECIPSMMIASMSSKNSEENEVN